jgi:hypothetical protein
MPFPSWDGFEGPDSTDCSTGGSLCREQDRGRQELDDLCSAELRI